MGDKPFPEIADPCDFSGCFLYDLGEVRNTVTLLSFFPRMPYLEILTLFWLWGAIEMKSQQQNYPVAQPCINATGSLLEWEQNASEQLTSGGYFCQQTVE